LLLKGKGTNFPMTNYDFLISFAGLEGTKNDLRVRKEVYYSVLPLSEYTIWKEKNLINFELMIERVIEKSSSSYVYKGERWESGTTMADMYCVHIHRLPERLWRVDSYDLDNPYHPLKVGIPAHDTTSEFPDTEGKIESTVLQLLSDHKKGPVSKVSSEKQKSRFVVFWSTPYAAEDVMKCWKLDRKGGMGHWYRTMIETAKMENEQFSLLEVVLRTLPRKDRARREAIEKEQYEGVYLVWHGVRKEAVAEHKEIGEQRMWELGLSQESFDDVLKGISSGALGVMDKEDGVVALGDFAKDLTKNMAQRTHGARRKGAPSVDAKGKGLAITKETDDEYANEEDSLLGVDEKGMYVGTADNYVVEEVLAHLPAAKGEVSVEKYLINWKGNWVNKYTWEPASCFDGVDSSPRRAYWARVEKVKMAKKAAANSAGGKGDVEE